jgi:hypothetical protein
MPRSVDTVLGDGTDLFGLLTLFLFSLVPTLLLYLLIFQYLLIHLLQHQRTT